MKRRIIWVTLTFLVILIVVMVIGAKTIPESSEEVLNQLDLNGIKYDFVSAQTKNSKQVGAFTFGDNSKPALLLIHGSPGDWSAWVNLFANDTILQHYYVIAVDRPGYGTTTTVAQSELEAQASAIMSIISKLGLKNIVIAGHSYGGAVVEQLLVEEDELFDLAILVAATASPEHMAPRWYNKVANWKLSQWLLPKDLLSSNIEMMGLPESLAKIETEIGYIKTPIILIQGTDDVLVPFETVDYFKRIKPTGVEYILLEEMNHFIPWSDPYIINDILLKQKIL